MSSFFVFLDDIAVLAKATAASVDDIVAGAGKAASKSIAVVIDDAAVTPQYVQGISPARELPIVWGIAKRSLANKAIILLAIMVLSVVVPWIFPWALIAGGMYLVYEGTAKIVHRFSHKGNKTEAVTELLERSPKDESVIIGSAATTDFVLSIEIMLIAVGAIESNLWWIRLAVLVVVGLVMTLLVYGAVGLLIKVDDFGRWCAKRGAKNRNMFLQGLGVGLVKLMPLVFAILTIGGVAAMLWVGGHLLITNFANVGFPFFLDIVHGLTHVIHDTAILWCVDTFIAALFGLAIGLILTSAMAVFKRLMGNKKSSTL